MSGQQTWDPAAYARNAGFVPALGAGVMDLLSPRAGERVLDLGCGDGVLTEKLTALGCEAVGVDSSAPQIEAARARGLDARVMSGERLTFEDEFDAVFSNAALHWMRDADAVIEGVRRALKPGGRFVAELGGYGCVAKIRAGLGAALVRRGAVAVEPWYFPSDAEYREKLERAGFRIQSIALFDRPTPLPTGLEGWLHTFAGAQLSNFSERERAAIIEEVCTALEPELLGPNGWFADYVRLRFAAVLAAK